MYKKLLALGGGFDPPDFPSPAGGSAPRPPFRLALRTLAMVRLPPLPFWQILDPPLDDDDEDNNNLPINCVLFPSTMLFAWWSIAC